MNGYALMLTLLISLICHVDDLNQVFNLLRAEIDLLQEHVVARTVKIFKMTMLG